MFAMRYCKKCLECFRGRAQAVDRSEHLMLNIPVEDEFGVIMKAYMSILAGDFLDLLDGSEDIIDISQHAELMKVEMPDSNFVDIASYVVMPSHSQIVYH